MICVLVCGGRGFDDRDLIYRTLDRLLPDLLPVKLIHGGCPTGADKIAGDWAGNRRGPHQVEVFGADWNAHGNAAGPIRNQQMIDEGKPNLVVAFPGGRGTEDMVRRSRKAGVAVVVICAAAAQDAKKGDGA